MQLTNTQNISKIFNSLPPETHSFNKKRIFESISFFNDRNIKSELVFNEKIRGLERVYSIREKSKEFKTICNWRLNNYSVSGSIKKTSILYKAFGKQKFTKRELAIAESFAQWLGTYVGQSWIMCKTKSEDYWKEYGITDLPAYKYLILTQLNSGDYEFLDILTKYMESNKATTYLSKNFYGLY